jgi:hypothetical protein
MKFLLRYYDQLQLQRYIFLKIKYFQNAVFKSSYLEMITIIIIIILQESLV